MRERGIMLVRPSRVFRFRLTVYRPDWHDPASDTYYEVLGSRQRKWAIVPLLDLMHYVYPDVALIALTPDAEPVTWSSTRRLRSFEATFTLGTQITAAITRLGWTYKRFSEEAGFAVGSSLLSQYMHGHARPSVDTATRIRATLDRLAQLPAEADHAVAI